MKIARRNVGIPYAFLVPNGYGLLDLSVFASTESKQYIDGPRSVMVMYWAPLSASWAFLEIAPANSIPPPSSRPELTSLALSFKVSRMVF